MHDIKQALFQTSIPDHEQHENKVSTIDFVRPPNIQILMHDIKQALFQTSIPDHEQHENKVSTIDFVRPPINDIEEETMEEVLIDVINEDDYNSYSRIDTSLFDHDAGDGKTKPAFVAALENLRREGPWIDTPGLVEIEYEEGNSIDEDSENV